MSLFGPSPICAHFPENTRCYRHNPPHQGCFIHEAWWDTAPCTCHPGVLQNLDEQTKREAPCDVHNPRRFERSLFNDRAPRFYHCNCPPSNLQKRERWVYELKQGDVVLLCDKNMGVNQAIRATVTRIITEGVVHLNGIDRMLPTTLLEDEEGRTLYVDRQGLVYYMQLHSKGHDTHGNLFIAPRIEEIIKKLERESLVTALKNTPWSGLSTEKLEKVAAILKN